MTAMRSSSEVVFYAFIALSIETMQVSSCVVSPSAAAVVVGNSINLTCTLETGDTVDAWRRDSDSPNAPRVYTSSVYNSSGIVITPVFIADGYSYVFLNDRMILTLKNATTANASYYWCICRIARTYGYSYISVVDSEPQFNAVNDPPVGESILLTCSLSVAGIVSSSISIVDSSGKVLISNISSISTNISQLQSVSCSPNVWDSIDYVYFCNITLRNEANSNEPKIVFTRRLNATVQFSVRNISISPKDPDCRSNGSCKSNVAISCEAKGSPAAVYQWTIYYNMTKHTTDMSSDTYITTYVGPQVIQCTAFNTIGNTTYNVSTNFTTNVTEEYYDSTTTTVNPNVPLIVGLVVGLGGGFLLILLIIILIICYKRQKRRTACCNLEPPKESVVEDRKERTDYASVKKGNLKGSNGQQGTVANGYAKSNGNGETVVVDNHLYSGSNNRDELYNTTIDPSDGGIQEAGYAALDEFGVNVKR